MQISFLKTVQFLFLLLFSLSSYAQLGAPEVEAVYGGRIRGITGIPLSADSTRIFVTTESANTGFFADVYHDPVGASVCGTFQVIPALNSAAGLGGSVEKIQGHAASGRLFYLFSGQLFSTHPLAAGTDTLTNPGVQAFQIYENYLLYLQGAELRFGLLDASGHFAENPASPRILPASGGMSRLAVHPITLGVYVMTTGISPALHLLTASLDSVSNSTSWTDISPTGLTGSLEWWSFGIGPDGRLFLGGSDFSSKQIAYSDDASTWTQYSTGFGGARAHAFDFGGDSSAYHVYYSSLYNDDNGNSGSWFSFGNPGGFETHPNDGPVFADPVHPERVYVTTDMGLGISEDRGGTLREINTGIEAVQVKDFDMTGDKEVAWLASKSGIRKVSTYTTSPQWSGPFFPMGDGSGYHATAMEPGDTNTVYAANLRVYKTTDGGSSWQRKFSAEDPPYNFPSFQTFSQGGAFVSCLEVSPYDVNIVFAGYGISMSDKGGLFYSHDGGENWGQLLLDASVLGQDVDVNDVIFTLEGSDTVAYVGVEYELAAPTGRSVYRLTKAGTSWTVEQDMNPSGTSTGAVIVATILDLHRSPTGDTLLAVGTDAGINHPIAYFKDLTGAGLWTPFTTTGFPAVSGKVGKAIALGRDTVYCAVDEAVYYHALGSSRWELGYQYPVGTEINFLYFDELLVGTSTGLYGHQGPVEQATSTWDLETESLKLLRLYPNPATTHITLEFPNPTRTAYQLTVMNVAGQVIWTRDNVRQPSLRFDRNDFPGTGLFLIELKGERTFTGKLLVE